MPMDSPACGLGGWRGVPAFNCFDRADLVAGRKDNAVAHLDRAGFDAPGQDAALVETINVLDGKTQRLAVGPRRGLQIHPAPHSTVGPFHQGMLALRDAMLSPCLAAMGMKHFGLHADGFEEQRGIRFRSARTRLAVIGEIHLVDQHGDLADAQQVQQVAVAAGLFLDAFVGVDQQQGGLGAGRAGDHVLEKFLVARARQ